MCGCAELTPTPGVNLVKSLALPRQHCQEFWHCGESPNRKDIRESVLKGTEMDGSGRILQHYGTAVCILS